MASASIPREGHRCGAHFGLAISRCFFQTETLQGFLFLFFPKKNILFSLPLFVHSYLEGRSCGHTDCRTLMLLPSTSSSWKVSFTSSRVIPQSQPGKRQSAWEQGQEPACGWTDGAAAAAAAGGPFDQSLRSFSQAVASASVASSSASLQLELRLQEKFWPIFLVFLEFLQENSFSMKVQHQDFNRNPTFTGIAILSRS